MPILLQGGNKVAECNHVFIGRSDGVHCTKCGLRMSASDYVKYLNSDKQEEKPNRQTRKKVKTDE